MEKKGAKKQSIRIGSPSELFQLGLKFVVEIQHEGKKDYSPVQEIPAVKSEGLICVLILETQDFLDVGFFNKGDVVTEAGIITIYTFLNQLELHYNSLTHAAEIFKKGGERLFVGIIKSKIDLMAVLRCMSVHIDFDEQ